MVKIIFRGVPEKGVPYRDGTPGTPQPLWGRWRTPIQRWFCRGQRKMEPKRNPSLTCGGTPWNPVGTLLEPGFRHYYVP